MKKVVIAGAVRTAIGKFGGTLKDVLAVDLGALVIGETLKRAGVSPTAVDEVIMGNSVQAGLGQNPSRQTAMRAGISQQVPSFTVNHVCGSGMKAVSLAAQAIQADYADCIVAGGIESMSGAPYLLKGSRWGLRFGHGEIVDSLLHDGLSCALSNFVQMGATAENIADHCKISRKEQDEFAALTQQRAEKAIKEGRFKEEIVPCTVTEKKNKIQFDTDEFPRFGTTVEVLQALKPAFKTDGTVTAGNSSGINDGAAAMVVLSDSTAQKMGVTPLATIVASASSGVDPLLMGLGPIGAVQAVLKKTGLALSDIDLFEVNEAFAAEILGILRELPIPLDRMNVNGGAIALGHPIGASGARVLTTLLYEMKRRDLRRGLATLCIGGGQGIAMIVERP